MEIYKVVKSGKKVFIKILCYNNNVWCGKQWFYGLVCVGSYPTDNEAYATDFETVKAAKQWIKEHTPS